LALEGNQYHSSTSTIRFEGDVILFPSTPSSLPSILPFASKASMVSPPGIFISRNSSSSNRFSVLDHALSALNATVALIRASGAKFSPTVALVNCSAEDLDLLFRDASVQNALMTDLAALLRRLHADGAVLDFHSCMGRQQALLFKPQLHRVLAFIGSSLLRRKISPILSVPPVKGSAVVDAQVFAAADFEALEYSFSHFHVPFSAHALPSATATAGPRAPLAWIIKSIRAMLPPGSVKTARAGKLLASIDARAAVFDRHGAGWHVDGDGLVQLLLNNTGRCAWDADAMEHSCILPPLPPISIVTPSQLRHLRRPRPAARAVSPVTVGAASAQTSVIVFCIRSCAHANIAAGAQRDGCRVGHRNRMEARRQRRTHVL